MFKVLKCLEQNKKLKYIDILSIYSSIMSINNQLLYFRRQYRNVITKVNIVLMYLMSSINLLMFSMCYIS